MNLNLNSLGHYFGKGTVELRGVTVIILPFSPDAFLTINN